MTWIASLRSQWRVAWFTLVELIVVITILVILGTIAFVSLGGYAGSARDSSRVSDLSLISKSLDIGYAKTGSYPSPTGAVGVTYSGAAAWYQGTVGDSVVLALGGVGSKISKKPTDPLLSTEYTYSLAAETREYSLATNYEGSSVAALTPQKLSVIAIPQTGEAIQINPSFSVFSNTEDSSWIASSLRSSQWRDGVVSEAFAESWNPTIVYVKGTYNGVVVKVSTGSKVNLLAVPNILVSSGITSLTGSSVGFLVHGSSNSGGLVFVPKLVYSSGALPNNDTDRIVFASGVVSAYSGTSLASNGNIAQFISAAGSTGALASIGGNFVGASLGGGVSNVVVSGGGVSAPSTTFSLSSSSVTAGTAVTITHNCATPPTNYTSSATSVATIGSVTTTWAIITTLSAGTTNIVPVGGNCTDTSAKVLTVTPAPLFASCTATGQTYNAGTAFQNLPAYGGGTCSESDKILCTGIWAGQIWSMCNVGATTTTNYNSTSTNRSSLANVDGKLFQFARNDPFDNYTATALTVATSSVATNVFSGVSATTWYYNSANWDWRNTQLSTITDSSVNIWTINPCNTNYHVPTQSEFQIAQIAFSNNTYGNVANLPTVLKMPYAGRHSASDGSLINQGAYGFYWSSSPYTTNSSNPYFSDSSVQFGSTNSRANGTSIRCIKN